MIDQEISRQNHSDPLLYLVSNYFRDLSIMDRVLYQLTIMVAGTCLGVAALSMVFSPSRIAQLPDSSPAAGEVSLQILEK